MVSCHHQNPFLPPRSLSLLSRNGSEEIKAAIGAGARIIVVNNRNLHDFSVDTGNAAALRRLVPGDVLFVAESGITCRDDVRKMEEIGADAVLVGEALMRADDKTAKLNELKGLTE